MARIVAKFGGTSVGSVERIEYVADLIMAQREQGNDVVVVVSAMAGDTNRLSELAHQIQSFPGGREWAQLVSCGEQVSMSLLAMALNKRGQKAYSYTAAQVGIRTDSQFENANVITVDTSRLADDLGNDVVPVVAGFQGCNEAGEVTTFGRGGSDFTAVLLASQLLADACHIYSDVEGIYTADPRLVEKARCLTSIPFEAIMELAQQGAKVMQWRSLEIAKRERIPIVVRSSFKPCEGTRITFDDNGAEAGEFIGIAHQDALAMITVKPNKQSVSALESLQEVAAGLNGSCTLCDDEHIRFVVADRYCREMCRYFKQTPPWKSCPFTAKMSLAKISAVGIGIVRHSEVLSDIVDSIEQTGTAVHFSEIQTNRLSMMVEQSELKQTLAKLHSMTGLESTT